MLYCFDIVIEEDLIEEVVCVYGYNSIFNVVLVVVLLMILVNEVILLLDVVKVVLFNCGYNEVIIYLFVDLKI